VSEDNGQWVDDTKNKRIVKLRKRLHGDEVVKLGYISSRVRKGGEVAWVGF
jgi:hypothetical protein